MDAELWCSMFLFFIFVLETVSWPSTIVQQCPTTARFARSGGKTNLIAATCVFFLFGLCECKGHNVQRQTSPPPQEMDGNKDKPQSKKKCNTTRTPGTWSLFS